MTVVGVSIVTPRGVLLGLYLDETRVRVYAILGERGFLKEVISTWVQEYSGLVGIGKHRDRVRPYFNTTGKIYGKRKNKS